MYVMLDVRRTGLDGIGFALRLLDEEAIAVMPGESFGSAAAGHIRIAMTVPDEDLGRAVARIVALADRIAGERPVAVSAR
jgi:arginine:pyruvate transaminase